MNIFSFDFDTDDREVLMVFDAPFGGRSYGIMAPDVVFWLQMLTLFVLQVSIGLLLGYILYKFIIPRRGSSFTYLIVFGIIIPFLTLFPRLAINTLGVQNNYHRLGLCLYPVVVAFRCMEATFGFSPAGAEHSLSNYLQYFCNLFEITFNPKTNEIVRPKNDDLTNEINDFFLRFIQMGVLVSILSPFSYEPFYTRVKSSSLDHGIIDLFQPAHLGNNFIAAVMMQHTLTVFSAGLRVISTLFCNVKTKETFRNPMFESTSPSDFWGRRWNLLIHGGLKRGVYLPTRKYYPKLVATFAAFLASGLMHEWILVMIRLQSEDENNKNDQCSNNYGKNLLFFLWNGIIIGLEYLVGGFQVFQIMKKKFPAPILSFSVVMLALPVGHLFTGDYVCSNFFEHGQIGFPLVVTSFIPEI